MSEKNLGLSARGHEFKSIMDNTICTNSHNDILDTEGSINQLIMELTASRDQGGSIYLIGNGGSAAITSHAITDFLNVCRLRAFTLHEPSLMTCLANDFGYENAFARIVNTVMRPGDTLIAISSSGKSANICNAVKAATEKGCTTVTFSGFNKNNMLRQLGNLNFWLDSSDYAIVEIGHLFILHNMADRIGAAMKKSQPIAVNAI